MAKKEPADLRRGPAKPAEQALAGFFCVLA